MRASLFVTAVMAAAVSASPALKVVEEVHTVTKYVHAGDAVPTAAPAPAPKPVVKPAPKPSSGGGFVQNHGGSSDSPSSGQPMLDVANKWRKKYGLNPYQWSDQLVPNCEETGQQGNGVQEIHKLMPGYAMGQVITPGQQVGVGDLQGMSPFEVAYVAWLCEVNSDPELQASANNGVDVCGVVQSTLTMAYGGETGHHKILTDPSYTHFGCAFTPQNGQLDPTAKYQGLYVCDVANL